MNAKKIRAIIFTTVLLIASAAIARAADESLKKFRDQPTRDAYRCATDYTEEEIAAIREEDDGYEPDDCPLLAHTLTGPELHFFCQPDDEDWVYFVAKANLTYEMASRPRQNYPTQPRLELLEADLAPIAQNDHYFGNDAAIWWWNFGSDRTVYVRVTELNHRAECGNDEYTLTLRGFTEPP